MIDAVLAGHNLMRHHPYIAAHKKPPPHGAGHSVMHKGAYHLAAPATGAK